MTVGLLVNWVSLNFNKKISLCTAYNIFSILNYSKIRAKKLSNKICKETLTNFREELSNLIISKDENTIILYENEAIVTSEAYATAIWTKVGVQPIVKTLQDGTRKRSVVFGATNA
ncbi:hypothetical protein [Clostridium beijerinckii]|uniref:hypothetical protein n=1 Tax=Clostridium beijerinckii TaxID=1520 RepID=UPI0022E4E819|nr:hypothetical protein [Clostridium beijerinckii]